MTKTFIDAQIEKRQKKRQRKYDTLRERYAVAGEARERYEVKEGERVKGRWIEKERVDGITKW